MITAIVIYVKVICNTNSLNLVVIIQIAILNHSAISDNQFLNRIVYHI